MYKNICFINGCFDVLHYGHVKLFEFAESLSDTVIVAIDSDRRIQSMKGISRPINNQEDRKYILMAIRHIHNVHIYDSEQELISLIQSLSPTTMLIGSDWKDKPIIGREYVKDLIYFDRITEYSTTNTLKRMSL